MELETMILEEVRQLRQQDNALRAEIKEKQIRVRDLTDEVQQAVRTSAQTIREAEARHRDRVAELERERAPLEEAQAALTRHVSDLQAVQAKLTEEHRQGLAASQHDHHIKLDSLKQQISDQTARYQAIGEAIVDCQRKVAAL